MVRSSLRHHPLPRKSETLVRAPRGSSFGGRTGAPVAKQKATTMTQSSQTKTGQPKPTQSKLELPAEEMERVRKVARTIGLSLSASVRQAVLEKTVEVQRRMGAW